MLDKTLEIPSSKKERIQCFARNKQSSELESVLKDNFQLPTEIYSVRKVLEDLQSEVRRTEDNISGILAIQPSPTLLQRSSAGPSPYLLRYLQPRHHSKSSISTASDMELAAAPPQRAPQSSSPHPQPSPSTSLSLPATPPAPRTHKAVERLIRYKQPSSPINQSIIFLSYPPRRRKEKNSFKSLLLASPIKYPIPSHLSSAQTHPSPPNPLAHPVLVPPTGKGKKKKKKKKKKKNSLWMRDFFIEAVW